ncbi:MAG: response regulator [Pseudomonadota bacterium]
MNGKKTKELEQQEILIVDDTLAGLQLLTGILSGHGYRVRPASDGSIALRSVAAKVPDIVLLDVKMPDIDGYEICRRLKSDDRSREVPVIFISALGETAEKVKGFKAGGVDYITKPFQAEEVLARVRTHLHLRELTEHLEQKVAERTEELQAANAQLQRELAERKQAEAALRQSETLLNATQRLAKIGGWDWDVEQQTSFWTEETYRIHGFEPQAFAPGTSEHIDRSLTCYEPADRPIIFAVFQRCVQQGDGYDLEFPFTSADGCRKWIRTTATAVREAGRINKVVGNIMDITERKQAEEKLSLYRDHLEELVRERTAELEAANNEMGAFSYSVSHDLRAPLRHIDGFLALLQKKVGSALDEQGRHYMDTISDSANKMGVLIDNLLSFSRMGSHALSFQQVDLETLVREVIRELEPDAAGRNIAWRISDLPAVGSDATLLRVVLSNLISNALKFTRPRQQAQIEIGSLPGRDSETVIFVRDNGVGFDMTYVDKLFGVFQRLHRADEIEGSGIGLANVHRIIARHGGRTWAEGKVDQGAAFYFSLPRT